MIHNKQSFNHVSSFPLYSELLHLCRLAGGQFFVYNVIAIRLIFEIETAQRICDVSISNRNPTADFSVACKNGWMNRQRIDRIKSSTPIAREQSYFNFGFIQRFS